MMEIWYRISVFHFLTDTIAWLPEKLNFHVCTLFDSFQVRAVKFGHVLVVDEADKASTHVTCILKSLVENGMMMLGDGRRIVSGT